MIANWGNLGCFPDNHVIVPKLFKGIKMTPLEASNIYLNKTEKSFSELLLLSADIFVEILNKYISVTIP